jgi:hypothetical protein
MTPKEMNEQKIESFEDYVETVGSFHLAFNCQFGDFTIYRGQKEDKPLLPSIARDELPTKEIREKEINIFEEFRRLSYPHLDLNFNYNRTYAFALK